MQDSTRRWYRVDVFGCRRLCCGLCLAAAVVVKCTEHYDTAPCRYIDTVLPLSVLFGGTPMCSIHEPDDYPYLACGMGDLEHVTPHVTV